MQYFLYRAIAKEPNVFEFTVVATHHSEQEAMQAEKYWIRFYQSTNDRFGYNMTEGGEGCVLRGSKNPMFGRSGRRLGTRHTEDTKRRMRESQSSLHKELVERRKCELSALGPLLTERGIIAALALDWKVSHTQVRRFIKKHIPL